MKVVLIMAMTLDGKIARHSLEPVDWTGRTDKGIFVEITKGAGVVIMGSKTYDTIGRPLPGRKNVVMTSSKDRQSNHENLIFTSASPEDILKGLADEGFESAVLMGGTTINDLFAPKGLIHEIYITVVPKLFGQGLSIFSRKLDAALELMEFQKIDDHALLLKYKVLP
ncbi:MAG: dihydrofolate reductase [Desulfamplus sp.]|nr:dihydrofolate reductase [Desulfamplus sp.]